MATKLFREHKFTVGAATFRAVVYLLKDSPAQYRIEFFRGKATGSCLELVVRSKLAHAFVENDKLIESVVKSVATKAKQAKKSK